MTAPAAEAIDELPYGWFAFALYHSSMTTSSQPSLTALLGFAQEGVESLGGFEELRKQHNRWTSINFGRMDEHFSHEEYESRIAGIWQDKGRLERCLDFDMKRFL